MPKILNYIKRVFFCLILLFSHFGFDKRLLAVNGIKEIGWFKNPRFRSLNSKPTFLSVIIGTIITYFGVKHKACRLERQTFYLFLMFYLEFLEL